MLPPSPPALPACSRIQILRQCARGHAIGLLEISLGRPLRVRCATRTKARSLPVSDGPVNWRSILLTPNILGKDGVSALSREMARALPAPALVVSLHDEPTTPDRSPVGVEVRGARGSRLSF